MGDYTIVIGGGQSASNGMNKGKIPYQLFLGRGSPDGDVHPWVDAPYGSEYVDCENGHAYIREGLDGDDDDWIIRKPVQPVAVAAVDEEKPKPKRKRRKKKEVDNA